MILPEPDDGEDSNELADPYNPDAAELGYSDEYLVFMPWQDTHSRRQMVTIEPDVENAGDESMRVVDEIPVGERSDDDGIPPIVLNIEDFA